MPTRRARPLAETSVLVEDFQPERLAFELETEAKAIGTTTPAVIDLTARYLYGATAPGLSIDGDIDIRPAETLAGFDGYHFGLAEEQIDPVREPIDLGAVTDEEGKATLEVGLPQLPVTTRPLEAQIIVRIADTNGRAVERRLTLPVTPDAPMIGIKPQFGDDEVEEGATANFDVILVAPDGAAHGRAGPHLAARADHLRLPVVPLRRELELRDHHQRRARRDRRDRHHGRRSGHRLRHCRLGPLPAHRRARRRRARGVELRVLCRLVRLLGRVRDARRARRSPSTSRPTGSATRPSSASTRASPASR